jgi:hypothetical protein
MTEFMSPVERLYRDIAAPKPQPKPAQVAEKKAELTRADVDAIIRRTRSASPEELQHILDNAKRFALTSWERQQISVDLTIAMAARARAVNGRRDDPSAEFVSRVLGLTETPHGFIERVWVHEQMRAGAEAIQRCRNHRPPRCQCWSAVRAILWQASASEKTPEAWAAQRIYDLLEELELGSRPERAGPD